LRAAIKTILSDDELGRRMGLKSSKTIKERFSLNVAVTGFVSAIEYACGVL
jgi:hypothetical protein